MTYFKVQAGKSYTLYSEDNGKYYRQNVTWWEKGGYAVPQSKKRITKEEYERMEGKRND